MLLKTNYQLEILKISQLSEHPRQKEPRLSLEIYLGSVKLQAGNFSFHEQKEIDLGKRLEGELYFGTRIEFWVKEAKSKETLAYNLLNYEDLFNSNGEEKTVLLSLGEHSYFQVTFVMSYTREELKEISQEDIEREQAAREEEERKRKEQMEEEARQKALAEEAERLAKLEEEAKKKPKFHPVTLTNKYQTNQPFY